MKEKTADKITKMLDSMDLHDMFQVIRMIQEDIGDKALLKVLESYVSSRTCFNSEKVASRASRCTEMDERQWYSMANDDGYGGYVDSGGHAVDVILDNLHEEFDSELRQIVLSGDKDSASDFLHAIADGLESATGILTEETEDFISEFISHLEECAENQDFDEVFKW